MEAPSDGLLTVENFIPDAGLLTWKRYICHFVSLSKGTAKKCTKDNKKNRNKEESML